MKRTLLPLLVLAACSPEKEAPVTVLTPIPAESQRAGDPAKGYAALVNEQYVTCGIPQSLFDRTIGDAPPELRLPGRLGRNEKLRYDYSAVTTANGTKLVTVNCLTCHAAVLDGKVVVGLGNSNADYTLDVAPLAEVSGQLISDENEKVEWRRWADRVKAVGPYTLSDTVGVNVADNLAPILFSHRDQKSLNWSNKPLLMPPPKQILPVDVPAWWQLKRKNAMFHTALGRGDQARIMMSASLLCTDDLTQAKQIDTYFPDVRAYLLSIEAPKYAGVIDAKKASEGEVLFNGTCSRCHGTYGAKGSYPNLVVNVEEVGTDPLLATATKSGGALTRFNDWFNGSFYGEKSRLEKTWGYFAPPLDGVWATAPYFHNGSVPTIAEVLNSKARPGVWTRNFEGYEFDAVKVGWKYRAVDYGKDQESDASERKKLYDTSREGFANTGHTYGDQFSAEQRAQVLEYLKTL